MFSFIFNTNSIRNHYQSDRQRIHCTLSRYNQSTCQRDIPRSLLRDHCRYLQCLQDRKSTLKSLCLNTIQADMHHRHPRSHLPIQDCSDQQDTHCTTQRLRALHRSQPSRRGNVLRRSPVEMRPDRQ